MGSIRRVLVVDDVAEERDALAAVLSSLGYQVIAVGTLKEARQDLVSRGPDCVVLDVVLEGESSLEFAQELADSHPKVVVIVVSGRADMDEMFALGRLPVHAFVPKPISPAALVAAFDSARPPELDLADAARRSVGRLSLKDARDIVRDAMVLRAIEVAAGNKTDAAEMLGTTRQAVQKALAEASGEPSAALVSSTKASRG